MTLPEGAAAAARDRGAGAVAFNALIVVLLAGSWLADAWWPEEYYRLVSEDGPMEWGTFWALIIGAVANALLATRMARGRMLAAWYTAGIALFCLLVAGEEISWGQRLIGYRPPEYFLAHNVQLEANIHNLLRPVFWSFGIVAIIGGFGIALPCLLLAEAPSRMARRAGVYAPPPGWVPGFVVLLAFYVLHPFHLCEEVAEAGLGLGLASAALWHCLEGRPVATRASRMRRPSLLVGAAVLAGLLGELSSTATVGSSATDDIRTAEARAELDALGEDFVEMRRERDGQFVTQCNFHARIHSIDRRVRLERLHEGAFSQVAGLSSPARARYFLDPWDMPYWLSDQCDSAARYILLYSFGPNRRRDSTHWEVGGDDVGAYAFHLGTPRPLDWRTLAFPERP